MNPEAIKLQLFQASNNYANSVVNGMPHVVAGPREVRLGLVQVLAAAHLSGCYQTANFLVMNDGSPGINPQNVLAACGLLAAETSLDVGTVKPKEGA